MTAEIYSFPQQGSPKIHRKQLTIDTAKGDRIRAQITYSDSSEGAPLLIAPGWSNGIESMGGLATLVASNTPVITLDHARLRSNYDPEERKRDLSTPLLITALNGSANQKASLICWRTPKGL